MAYEVRACRECCVLLFDPPTPDEIQPKGPHAEAWSYTTGRLAIVNCPVCKVPRPASLITDLSDL